MTLSYKDVAFDLQVSLMRLTLELKIKKQDSKIFYPLSRARKEEKPIKAFLLVFH